MHHFVSPAYILMIVVRSLTACSFGRWKELRPMMEPKPPRSRMARTSSNTSSSLSSVGPPEKNTMRLPLKVPWTTCRTRSAGERHRLGVAPAFNGQLEVVVGVVSGWVHTEATGGPMLETLVDWQDHQLAGSCQPPMGQEERQARLGPRVVTLLPAQNLPHANEHVGASNRGCDFGHCASDRHQSPLTLPVQPTPSRIRSA